MKKLGFIFIVIIMVASFTGCSSSRTNENQIVWGIRIDSMNYVPQIITTEKNLIDQNKANYITQEFNNNDDIKTAIASNKINIASLGITDALSVISQGVPIKIIALCIFDTGNLYVRNDGQINTIQDLRNKKIGGDPGGSTHLLIAEILKENNFDLQKDVEFVKLKKEYYSIALSIKNEVDAIMASSQDEKNITKENAIMLPEWKEKDYDSRYIAKGAIVVRNDFLEKNKQMIEEFLKGYKKSFESIAQNQNETAEIVNDYIATKTNGANTPDAESTLKYFKIAKFNPWIEPQELEKMINMAFDLKIIDKKIDVNDALYLPAGKILND